MAEIALKGRMKVKTLKAEFKEAFGATLRVYKSVSCKVFADDDATLASIRQGEAKGGDLAVKGNMQVGNFEKKIAEMYGIGVQVANADDSKLVDNGVTLASIGKGSDCKKKEKKSSETIEEENKKFRIEIQTKGSRSIAIASIDTDEIDVDDMTSDDAMDFDLDYIAAGALGDEFDDNPFELKVYDENNEIVFESDSFCDFNFIASPDFMIDDILDNMESEGEEITDEYRNYIENAIKIIAPRYTKEANSGVEGVYLVSICEDKWRTFSYFIEDSEFDPKKLLFVANKGLEGLGYDYSTDSNHMFYGNDFLESNDDDDDYDSYGTTYYIAEYNQDDACFEIVNELE